MVPSTWYGQVTLGPILDIEASLPGSPANYTIKLGLGGSSAGQSSGHYNVNKPRSVSSPDLLQLKVIENERRLEGGSFLISVTTTMSVPTVSNDIFI